MARARALTAAMHPSGPTAADSPERRRTTGCTRPTTAIAYATATRTALSNHDRATQPGEKYDVSTCATSPDGGGGTPKGGAAKPTANTCKVPTNNCWAADADADTGDGGRSPKTSYAATTASSRSVMASASQRVDRLPGSRLRRFAQAAVGSSAITGRASASPVPPVRGRQRTQTPTSPTRVNLNQPGWRSKYMTEQNNPTDEMYWICAAEWRLE